MFNITTGLTIWCSEATTLAVVLFFAWRSDRRSSFYLLWSIGFALRAVGYALISLQGVMPNVLTIDLGNVLTFLGQSAWIAGFSLFDKRRPEWTALLPPAIWLIGISLPWVHDDLANRVVLFLLASAASATLLAAAVRPATSRPEAARMPLAFVLMTLASLCFVIALSAVVFRPSPETAVTYRTVTVVVNALLITIAVALTGHVLVQRSQRRWRALSLNDSLTSAFNRRGLLEFFGLLRRETTSPSRRIAALLFDLDHFKSINDRYGHQTGDQVLCEFVTITRKCLPRGGALGRMGGEEFMAFITVTDQTEAEAVAETIRSEFCRVPLQIEGAAVNASVSVGVALATAEAADWDKLTGAADRALYAAKRAGRNCTVVFSEAATESAISASSEQEAGELVPTVDDQIQALQRIGTLARN
ncbi:GGDEF domain-containing protein [Rhizobium sp. VS19-DR104.2]|uniref:GGDEF domain-containing protein n=1 Tax=unclassified Rhizobium TaxID=2613769 RepID=UPI001C5BA4FF|nr:MULTISPECIES: GGDEF domain-containing protein [unclassified Rhizobium]MBZ5760035.1 GGDEF domain-containing protein [Rhizobium sp. VS19-DR96]MBZ5766484.1 GGDEF domain-containing protein [Rhizobium sp. VS19-DR129.2]MBZ5774173.1 GGDEF domain-containing protein [Rhizobium sp. VS19-DRK62.2]MBZ5785245.1 GGDEF domain-containing protein [Rhizobium sp. VS19-DR121]MBZ5802844.1 GGDEF domain-containing protein [Rhizobium sp. VS19-DR181]